MLAVQVDYWNAQEKWRSNKAQERLKAKEIAETKRANKAREEELHRSNLAQEELKQQEIAELVRSHKQQELLSEYNLNETRQHNRAQEEIASKQAQASLMSAGAAQTSSNASLISAHAAETNASVNLQSIPIRQQEIQVKRDTSLFGLIGTLGAATIRGLGSIGGSLINNWASNNAADDGLSVLWSIGE